MPHVTRDTEQYIDNKEHNPILLSKRVMLAGNTNQIFWDDDTTANITYIGTGAKGLATSADGWNIMKVDDLSKTIQTAISAWDDRTGASYE